jgi:hypothetical protein
LSETLSTRAMADEVSDKGETQVLRR